MSAVIEHPPTEVDATTAVIAADTQPALGLHVNMPDKDYRRAHGANKSMLDDLNISPALAHWRRLHPDPPTPAMNLGQALHTLVLEPHLFESRFVRSEYDTFQSKEAKQWRALQELAGLTVLRCKSDNPVRDPSEWDRAHAMAEAVRNHPIAGTLFADQGPTELSMFWIDQFVPGRRRLCKGRLDKWCEGHTVIADLKKVPIEGAAMSNFARKVNDYRYHVQAAYYLDGAHECGLRPRAFVFVVVEEGPPYQVACYTLPLEWLHQGRQTYIRDLERYSECMESGDWPTYPDEVREIQQPGYTKFSKIS